MSIAPAEAWHAMYQTAEHVMGIPQRHANRRYILHLTPDVANLA